MQMAKMLGDRVMGTVAGWTWNILKWHERHCPFNDDQENLFDMPPITTPKSKRWGKRRERMEWAVRLLSKGFALRVGDYALDVSFNHPGQIVRLSKRVVVEVYEIAEEMGLVLTDAGEIDWRSTEMMPEDYYAA